MYYHIEEALKLIYGTDNEAICVEGELKGFRIGFNNKELYCEEPDGTSYIVNLRSIKLDDNVWVIVK